MVCNGSRSWGGVTHIFGDFLRYRLTAESRAKYDFWQKVADLTLKGTSKIFFLVIF